MRNLSISSGYVKITKWEVHLLKFIAVYKSSFQDKVKNQ